MTNILVFDDIIDLEYQEQIKSTLLGTKQYKNYHFPWYLTKDVTKGKNKNSQTSKIIKILYNKKIITFE